MGDYNFTVNDLTTQIRIEAKMNVAQLGSTLTSQNTFMYYYINECLWELAAEIKKKKTTDPLVVTSDGYVDFQISGSNIEDFYAPLRILTPDESGKQFQRRTYFDGPVGWFKESQNDRFHIKGAGMYVLQYIAYPTKATSADQVLDIPQTSYGILKDRTIARIKESLDDLEGTKMANTMADAKVPNLVKANKNATGENNGMMS